MVTDLMGRDALDAPPATDPSSRGPRTRWTGAAVVAALGGAAGAMLFLLAHRGMPDDSYITLDYARNLAEHGHWGLTQFRHANSATSPLNVWLLAAGIVVTGRPVVAAGLVLVAATAVTAVFAAGLADALGLRRRVVAGLTVGLVVTSPIFASVVGMEAFLVAALLVGVARYAAVRRPAVAGVLTGLAVLARPDLALPAVVLLGVLFLGRTPRRPAPVLRALGVAVAVALPWHVWSWFVLGSFVPDSLIIKAGQAYASDDIFGNGPWLLYERYPVAILLVGVVALAGLVALGVAATAWARGRDRLVDRVIVACGLAGLAHYGAYAAMGVPPYTWYYAPSLALLTLCAALGAADLCTTDRGTTDLATTGQDGPDRGAPDRATPRTGVAVTALVLVAGVSAGLQIALGVPWSAPVIWGNYTTAAQYLVVGEELRAALPPGASVQAPGEIGVLAYGCDCDIVDGFADQAQIRVQAEDVAARSGPVTRTLLRLNFLHADPAPPRPFQFALRLEHGDGPGWPTTDRGGRVTGRFVLGPPGPESR